MTNQFSPKVSEILAYSREEAARLASQDVAPEHLLLGMMRMKEGPVADFGGLVPTHEHRHAKHQERTGIARQSR